jgi:hypothetical protein
MGSLHHAPFSVVRREVAALTQFLRPGGKAFMLAYPKERYLLSGRKSFRTFGKATDGERTPWAEWYDDAKAKALFGPSFELTFSKVFGRKEPIDFNWFELTKLR